MLLHFSPAVSSLLISKCINYHVHITAGKLPRVKPWLPGTGLRARETKNPHEQALQNNPKLP